MADPFQGTGPAASYIARGVKENDPNSDYLCDKEHKRVPFPRANCPFNIPPKLLDECKVPADHVIIGPTDPNRYEGTNAVEMARAQGAYEVIHPRTKRQLYHGMGNVCMAIPREVFEAQQAETDRESAEYIAPFKENRDGQMEANEEFDRENKGYFREAAQRNSQNWRESQIIGDASPTHGLSYEDGLALLEKQGVNVEQMSDEYRRGPRHHDMSRDDWKKMIGGGKTTYGAIDAGFGRNQNSAVAQAARARANK